MLQQVFQHRPFTHRQFDHALAHAGPLGRSVQRQIAQRQHGRFGRIAARQRFDARHQFGAGEGLDQVVVGAQLQAAHAVYDGIARRQQQYRYVAAARAQPPHHFEAVDAGQADIEHYHVRRIGTLQHGVRLAAVVDHVDCHAMPAKHARQAVGQHGIVFHYQYMHVSRRKSSAKLHYAAFPCPGGCPVGLDRQWRPQRTYSLTSLSLMFAAYIRL